MLFGELVGVPVAPGADVGAVMDYLAREGVVGMNDRIDKLKARGAWTTELEQRYQDVSALDEDDVDGADAAVRALFTAIARAERAELE